MIRLLVLSVLVVTSFSVRASTERQIIGSEQDHSLSIEASDCEHFYKQTFTMFTAQVNDQEQREIALAAGEPQLRIDATNEGGVSIQGWNKPYARLTVCRFAAANSRAHALRLLGAINVASNDGHVRAFGPPNDSTQAWWVNLILHVPRGANVDVRAHGGGVAIRNMHGRVKAHATSGGISVVQSTGNYVVSTESGGITLDRVSGRVDAESRRGSIALKLPAGTSAARVEARTAEAHIVCTLPKCGGRWAADRKHLVLGRSPADFRIATLTAPIMIGPVTN